MRNKSLTVLLSAALLISMAGCAKTAAVPATTTTKTQASATAETTAKAGFDGTYTGLGQGKGGDIQVEVVITDGAISQINVLKHGETQGYDKAMTTLTEALIAKNSLEVDAVTGATLTSKGFLEAVTAALAAGNITSDMLIPKKGTQENTLAQTEETHEIIVIGAGGAGLTAAIEAKEAGAEVIILEKMPMAGGNTLISGAEMAAPGNWIQEKEGLEDSPEQMAADMMAGGDNLSDPALVKVVSEQALAAAIWLRDQCNVIWEDELMFFGGHSVKRSLIPLGASGVEIIEKLTAKAESLNIPIYYSTKATELIADETGKVVGVKAESDQAAYTFHSSKAVILATGGFGSNVEMRVKYNPDIDEKILSTNTIGSTGDGIVMAEALGANLVGMEYIQTYPICDPLTGTLLYFDDARLYGHTVIVNKEGKRFVEELGRRDVMSMGIKAQTGNVCYEIVDQAGFDASKLAENHGPEIDYLYKNKLLVKADTLEEAAAFFEIDAQQMKKTLEDYNSYVDAGSDPEFNKRSLPSKIETAPYYILKAAPAVHHTMGGVQINTEAQVLRADKTVIEGLFACGEVTGGIHGSNRLGSNAIADITVFGRIAGTNAAK